jgi:hypothetical protein
VTRVFLCLALTTGLACVVGCGSSPREAGKAYAKSIIAELDNGHPDPVAIQKASLKAQSKVQGMSAAAGVKFMEGYQEAVQEWIHNKLP